MDYRLGIFILPQLCKGLELPVAVRFFSFQQMDRQTCHLGKADYLKYRAYHQL